MSWPLIKLGELEGAKGNFVDGPFGSNLKASEYIDHGTPIIQLKNIKPNEYLPKDIKFVSAEKAKSLSRHSYQPGDVVIAKLGAVGTACIIPESSDNGIIVADVVRFRGDKQRIDYKYLCYFLNSAEGQRRVQRMSRGSTRTRTNLSDLKNLEVPLPPLDTQKQITAILEKADQLRKDCQQMEQELNNLAQSVFMDMFGDPVSNPKGWKIGCIGDLMESVSYGTSEKSSEEVLEYPVLRMNNITYEGGWDFTSLKYMDMTEKDKSKYLVHKGELLFNRTNSKELVGKTAVFREDKPMAFAGYLIRSRCNELANPEYISAVLNSRYGKQTLFSMCKSIVGMANINAKEFQKIQLPIPPVALQNEFATRISKILEYKKCLGKESKTYERLFGSLMQKAFSGELKIKNKAA